MQGIFVANDYAYLAVGTGGFHIIDVSSCQNSIVNSGTIGTKFIIEGIDPGIKEPKVYLGDDITNKWSPVKFLNFNSDAQTITCLVSTFDRRRMSTDVPVDMQIITSNGKISRLESFTYLRPQIQSVTFEYNVIVEGINFGDSKSGSTIFFKSNSITEKCNPIYSQWNPNTGESQVICKKLRRFKSGDVITVSVINKVGQDQFPDSFTIQ